MAAPLKFTIDEELKFVPFTVKVKAPLPTVAFGGESVVTVGTGLFTVKVLDAVVPPPGAGLVTVTFSTPAVVVLVEATVTTSCVANCDVIENGGFPPKLAVESAVKFVPVMVRVKEAEPAKPLVGLIDVSVGTGETPVPVRATVKVESTELFEIFSVAVREPAWTGLKIRAKLQDSPGVNTFPAVQVVPEETIMKSPGFAPASKELLIVRFCAAFPLFVTVMIIAELCAPTGWFPKPRLMAESCGIDPGVMEKVFAAIASAISVIPLHEPVPGSAKTDITGAILVLARRSSATIVAVNCVEDTKCVGRLSPRLQSGLGLLSVFH